MAVPIFIKITGLWFIFIYLFIYFYQLRNRSDKFLFPEKFVFNALIYIKRGKGERKRNWECYFKKKNGITKSPVNAAYVSLHINTDFA